MDGIYSGSDTHMLTHRFTRESGFMRWTLALTYVGSVKTSTAMGSVVMGSPSLMLIEPNTPYTVNFGATGKAWQEYWIIFDDAIRWHRWLNWPWLIGEHSGVRGLPLRDTAHRQAISQAMREAHAFNNQATLSPSGRKELLANTLERVLLLADQINPNQQRAMMDDRVRQAMEILASPDNQNINMDDLAARVHVSASHLTHLFSQQVGQSPMQFHEQQRHRRAAELLLATNLRIGQIATAVGYENAFHFSTRFAKWAGVSPRAFREGKTNKR